MFIIQIMLFAVVWLIRPACVSAGGGGNKKAKKWKHGIPPYNAVEVPPGEELGVDEVRRRTVYRHWADGSTRARWVGEGYYKVDETTGAVSLTPMFWARSYVVSRKLFSTLRGPERFFVACAGACGFRVHTDARMGGFCCTCCCVYTRRAEQGFSMKGIVQHGDRCVSRRLLGQNEDSRGGQLFDSGDEATCEDWFAPSLYPSVDFMSDEAWARLWSDDCTASGPQGDPYDEVGYGGGSASGYNPGDTSRAYSLGQGSETPEDDDWTPSL